MGYGPLERFLVPERIRPRADSKVGHAMPIMQEVAVRASDEPLLVTNTRGSFVQTRRAKRDAARTAFFYCPLNIEMSILGVLVHELDRLAGPAHRFGSVPEAIAGMVSVGESPCAVVISPTSLGPDVPVEQARRLMEVAGYVSVADGVYTLLGDLPSGMALVVARQAGHYLRSGDWLALMLLAIDRRFAVVSS